MKNQNKRISVLRKFLPYLAPFKFQIFIVFFCMITSNIALLYIPDRVGAAVDMIGTDGNMFPLIAQMLIAASFAWLLTALQNIISVNVGQSVVANLRQKLFAHMERLPVSYYDKMTKGNMMSIMITDISNVSETASADLISLLAGFVSITGSFIMMLAISPQMTLVFAVTVPLMILATVIISKNARRLHFERKTYFGKLCGYTEEMISAQKSLFVYGQEEVAINNFTELSKGQFEKGTKAEFCSSLMMPAMNGLTNLNLTLVAAVGAYLALTGVVSVGNISSFILYSKKFGGPISDAASVVGMLQSSLAACERIFTVLEAEQEKEVLTTPTLNFEIKSRGDIEFSHVAFHYDESTPILKDINFKIKSGQKVAVVGSTGAGKTTLISLLFRFYNPISGTILLDGKSITQIPLADLRRQFAMVLQDTWLFEGTVYENLSYAMPEDKRSKEKVREICRAIGAEEMIEGLPNGYDHYLRSDSTALSQGQKQLLSMVRAFLCEPSLFILDEATSAVDPQTEHEIQAVTDKILSEKTSIIIAHRLSTILTADCILVLKDGYVEEQGSHEELINKGGLYKSIFESQFAQ